MRWQACILRRCRQARFKTCPAQCLASFPISTDSTTSLWGAYLIFAFQRAFAGNVGPYALSSFGEHSLLPAISLVSNIMSGVVYLPMAKAINIYGRAESHIAMALVSAVGLVLLAAARNIETYSAGVVS